jgi:hypothetical protein
MRLRLAALCLLLLGACYKTPKPDCGFVCGPGGACPSDYTCASVDNRCHRVGAAADLMCPAPVDASIIDAVIDAPKVDGAIDAPLDAAIDAPIDAPTCPALSPTADGSGRQALVVAEFLPGMTTGSITFYNNTAAAIALNPSSYAIQSDTDMITVQSLFAAATSLPAKTYITAAWTSALATDAGGEIALYQNITVVGDYAVETNLVDYLCWGTTNQMRKALAATGSNKFPGACDAAITATKAIKRLPNTMGTTAADYDVTMTPAKLACTVP